jgi:hypothetical protein
MNRNLRLLSGFPTLLKVPRIGIHHLYRLLIFVPRQRLGYSLLRNVTTNYFVSGYYWCPPTPVTNAHCVAWFDPNLDRPYAGKHDRIAKQSFTLAEDTSLLKSLTQVKLEELALSFSD